MAHEQDEGKNFINMDGPSSQDPTNRATSSESIQSSNSFGGVFVGNGILNGAPKPGGALFDKKVLEQVIDDTKRQPWIPIRTPELKFSELELEVIRIALADFAHHGKLFFDVPGNQSYEGHLHPIAASMSLVFGVLKSLQEKLGRSIYVQRDTTSIVEKAVAEQINSIEE